MKYRAPAVVLTWLLFFLPIFPFRAPAAEGGAPEAVWISTEDGYSVRADYYAPAAAPKAAVILVHMLGRDRSDWRDFAAALGEAGYSALALDLRGHGGETKSLEGARSNWKDFSPEDFRAMVRDVEAAHAFLQREGREGKGVFVAGASLGANVALLYASKRTEISGAILLSPGLDYRGVRIARAMNQYGTRPVLLIAARDDEYADTSARYLMDLAPASDKKFVEYPPQAGHGTQIFKFRPAGGEPAELSRLLREWLDEKTGAPAPSAN
jgi:pimeloyl-ACP methyl ester carboxylesterase